MQLWTSSYTCAYLLSTNVFVLDKFNISGRESHPVPFVRIQVKSREIDDVLEIIRNVHNDLRLKKTGAVEYVRQNEFE